jgi:hypothetical protein
VKSREFAEAYLDILPDHVARAITVIEDIDALLQQVRRDCE